MCVRESAFLISSLGDSEWSEHHILGITSLAHNKCIRFLLLLQQITTLATYSNTYTNLELDLLGQGLRISRALPSGGSKGGGICF